LPSRKLKPPPLVFDKEKASKKVGFSVVEGVESPLKSKFR
jgi:hypothetical protein